MYDDMFEPIPPDEIETSSIEDRLNKQERKIHQFQVNQAKIQIYIEELRQSSLSLDGNSSLYDIQQSLLGIAQSLDEIKENNILNEEVINKIRDEHIEIEAAFMKIKNPIDKDNDVKDNIFCEGI